MLPTSSQDQETFEKLKDNPGEFNEIVSNIIEKVKKYLLCCFVFYEKKKWKKHDIKVIKSNDVFVISDETTRNSNISAIIEKTSDTDHFFVFTFDPKYVTIFQKDLDSIFKSFKRLKDLSECMAMFIKASETSGNRYTILDCVDCTKTVQIDIDDLVWEINLFSGNEENQFISSSGTDIQSTSSTTQPKSTSSTINQPIIPPPENQFISSSGTDIQSTSSTTQPKSTSSTINQPIIPPPNCFENIMERQSSRICELSESLGTEKSKVKAYEKENLKLRRELKNKNQEIENMKRSQRFQVPISNHNDDDEEEEEEEEEVDEDKDDDEEDKKEEENGGKRKRKRKPSNKRKRGKSVTETDSRPKKRRKKREKRKKKQTFKGTSLQGTEW